MDDVTSRFDIIFDCAGQNDKSYFRFLHSKPSSMYISLSSPVLNNADTRGLAFGGVLSIADLVAKNLKSLSEQKGTFRWAYFMPLPGALEELSNLVEKGQVIQLLLVP